MNKKKVLKKSAKILGLSADDEELSKCLKMVEDENYGANFSDEEWVYGVVAGYSFCAGLFNVWKEYQVKFNQVLRGGK